MTFTRKLLTAFAAMALAGAVQAQQAIKIGLILPLSGPTSVVGKQMLDGVNLYMERHGNTIGGRKVELLIRDDTGLAPDLSKRAAQELINQENVDVLAGFGFTPGAFAVAPLASAAKKPMIIMNAATSSITEKSPYIVRTSETLPQYAAPIAMWAAKNNIKKVYTLVADYGPGIDAETHFVKTFKAAGGTIAESVRMPVQNPDYAPFLQRVKDAKPDAIFVFIPAGEQGVAFIKGYKERGLDKEGIQLISTGDVVTEDQLGAIGDLALGLVTSFNYSEAHPSKANQEFTAAYFKKYPDGRPSFLTVGAYDGMHLIYEVLKKTGGDASGDAFVAAAKGMAWESPRGPISIDPETRDIIQNIYIRKVEKVNGRLQNVEFDHIPAVKDPGKQK
jgi:branched-chain amino acid transport system substrate-binding protein